MTPEQLESIQRHRERMAAIHTSGLTAVNTLAQANAQAILNHSTSVTKRKQEAIDETTEYMRKVINGQSPTGEVEGTV